MAKKFSGLKIYYIGQNSTKDVELKCEIKRRNNVNLLTVEELINVILKWMMVNIKSLQYLDSSKYKNDVTVRFKMSNRGSPGGSAVLRLPSAQSVILESWGRVPRRAPCMELLLPLPGYLPLSLSLSILMNK